MLTLDVLAKMARRMAAEPTADGAYRRPDQGTRTRTVDLLFGLAVGLSALVLTPTGVLVTHGAELLAGQVPEPLALLRTGAWFLGATLLFIVPFSAIGLWREVRRYRRVRQRLGERAILEPSGVLRSEDGSRRWRL